MNSRITRRRFVTGLAAISGGTALASLIGAGCAPKPTPQPAAAKPQAQATAVAVATAPAKAASKVTIRVQNIGGALGQYIINSGAQFTKENPNIEVVVEDVPYGEMSQKTAMGFAAGNLPDTLHAFTTWLWLGCYKGWYLPLDELLQSTDAVKDYSDFYQPCIENVKWEGKTYCLLESPVPGAASFITWNRQLIADAGQKPPTPDMTMQDLQALALKCTNKDKGIFGIELSFVSPHRLENNTRSWGKPLYGEKGDTSGWLTSPDRKKFRFGDNPIVENFYKNYLKPLLDARAQPVASDQVQGGLFIAQKCAMMQGHQGIPLRQELAIGGKWEYHPEDTILLPKGPDGRRGTSQETQVKCVYSKTKHPEEALRVLGYLLSKEAGLVSLTSTGNYSGRSSVYMDPKFLSKYPFFKDFDTLMKSGQVEQAWMPWNFRDVEASDAWKQNVDPLHQIDPKSAKTWAEVAPIAQQEVQRIFDQPRP